MKKCTHCGAMMFLEVDQGTRGQPAAGPYWTCSQCARIVWPGGLADPLPARYKEPKPPGSYRGQRRAS